MPIQTLPPAVPPIIVHWLMTDKPFYQDWDFWVSCFTLLLVLVTGYLGYQTFLLRRDSMASVTAAQNNAQSAQNLVDISQASMQHTLRAYVTLKSLEATQLDNNKVPNGYELIFVNTGQTPARNPELYYIFKTLDDCPAKRFDPSGDEYRRWPRTDIGRDQPVRFWKHGLYRTDTEREEIATKAKFLYIYGALRYRDIFSDDDRFLPFCYVWDMNQQQFLPVGAMNYQPPVDKPKLGRWI